MKPAKQVRSQAQERRIASRLSARQHSGSGNGWLKKNDSSTRRLQIENKRTDNLKSITLRDDDLRDVVQRAALEGREAVMAVELAGRDYYVVTADFGDELIEAWLGQASSDDSLIRKPFGVTPDDA